MRCSIKDWKLEVLVHSFEWWLQGREGECQSNSLLPCRKLRNLQVYICKSGPMITAVTSKEHMKQLFAPFFHCFNLLLKWTRWSPESLAFCLYKFRACSRIFHGTVSKGKTKEIISKSILFFSLTWCIIIQSCCNLKCTKQSEGVCFRYFGCWLFKI